MNDVFLTGNLGADPEFVNMSNGKQFSKFSLAVNRGYKDQNGNWQNKASWFNIICYLEYRQEKISTLRKGDPVMIHGRLEQDSFQGKDGRNHVAVKIVIDTIQKLERQPRTENQRPAPAPGYGQAQDYGQQGRQGGWNGTGPSYQPQAPAHPQGYGQQAPTGPQPDPRWSSR